MRHIIEDTVRSPRNVYAHAITSQFPMTMQFTLTLPMVTERILIKMRAVMNCARMVAASE